MNHYEAKQEERRERYEELADKADRESSARIQASSDAVAFLPLGQPIILGHHSEGMHRAALKRSHGHMDKSIEASNRASYYRSKADGVGRAGISSDDPDAIQKLQTKLAGMEATREQRKAINAAWRKAGRPEADNAEGWQRIGDACGLDADALGKLRVRAASSWSPQPFAPYEFQNLGGNIRRVRERIADLEEVAEEPDREPIHLPGITIEEDREDNRIRVTFDAGRPPREATQVMRQWGFRWSPRNVAWQRQLNGSGRFAAGEAARVIGEAGILS